MILDSGAVVAILRGEPEAEAFRTLIESVDTVAISAASVVELSLVVGPDRQEVLDRFLAVAGAVIEPVDGEQVAAARRAAMRFGRGSGSVAKLNVGDCVANALAAVAGQPLLCKGDDFVHTDLELAR